MFCRTISYPLSPRRRTRSDNARFERPPRGEDSPQAFRTSEPRCLPCHASLPAHSIQSSDLQENRTRIFHCLSFGLSVILFSDFLANKHVPGKFTASTKGRETAPSAWRLPCLQGGVWGKDVSKRKGPLEGIRLSGAGPLPGPPASPRRRRGGIADGGAERLAGRRPTGASSRAARSGRARRPYGTPSGATGRKARQNPAKRPSRT